MKKWIIIGFLLFIPLIVRAAAIPAKNINLASDQVADGNYYAIGNNVDIQGTVNSDLIIIAGNASVSGLVRGDVLFLGGNLKITGEVDGNIRGAAGMLELNGQVGKNVLVAVGNFITNDKNEINGNLTLAASTAKIDGAIQGRFDGLGGNFNFNNEVKNDVNLKTDSEGAIILSAKTHFYKNFYYQSVNKVQLEEGAKIDGQTNYQPLVLNIKKFINRVFLLNKIVALFSLLIVGLILISLFYKKVDEITDLMIKNPFNCLWKGLVFLIIIPVLVLLLLLTIIGLPLGLMILTVYLIILYASQVLVGLVIGYGALKGFQGEAKPILLLIVGLIVYEIIISLPYLGGFIKFIALLWALGAIWEIIKPLFKKEEKPVNV